MKYDINEFLKNRSDKIAYGIIRETYNPFIDIKEARTEAAKKLNRALYDYNKSSECTISEKLLIILWSGLEDNKFLNKIGHSNDFLLSCLAKELKNKKDVVDLYIYSPLDLVEKGDNTVAISLSRIATLWKNAGVVPTFLNHDFLDMPSLDTVTDEEMDTYKNEHHIQSISFDLFEPNPERSETQKELVSKLMAASNKKSDEYVRKKIIRDREKAYFERFFKSILTLDSYYKKEKKQETPYVLNFIECYYKWQCKEMTMQQITHNIEAATKETPMSKTRFYDHNKKFEESPVYPEYTNCFASQIRNFPKKGSIPDFFEFLVIYYSARELDDISFDECVNALYSAEDIHSLWDVERIHKRCLSARETFIHKYGSEAFDKRLEETIENLKKMATK